jgi:hypothetical protein
MRRIALRIVSQHLRVIRNRPCSSRNPEPARCWLCSRSSVSWARCKWACSPPICDRPIADSGVVPGVAIPSCFVARFDHRTNASKEARDRIWLGRRGEASSPFWGIRIGRAHAQAGSGPATRKQRFKNDAYGVKQQAWSNLACHSGMVCRRNVFDASLAHRVARPPVLSSLLVRGLGLAYARPSPCWRETTSKTQRSTCA